LWRHLHPSRHRNERHPKERHRNVLHQEIEINEDRANAVDIADNLVVIDINRPSLIC